MFLIASHAGVFRGAPISSLPTQMRTMGAIHSTKLSGIFGPKLNGSVRSNRKSFEKTGPPFEVVLFSRSDRLEFWLNGSRPICSREIFTKRCRQQQNFDSDAKEAWHYNHVTFTPIAKDFMLYCRLIYMLSMPYVRLTIKAKVGIPESFKVGWCSVLITIVTIVYCYQHQWNYMY